LYILLTMLKSVRFCCIGTTKLVDEPPVIRVVLFIFITYRVIIPFYFEFKQLIIASLVILFINNSFARTKC